VTLDLVVVGLDGLSYNMLERFDVDSPYIESVTERGVSGDLMSTDTPTTIPAWTSFATGKDPGTHGVQTMTELQSDYSSTPARTNRTEAGIYDFLNESVFVNLPATKGRTPAGRETLLVSGMLARDEADAVPEELQSLASFEDYVLDHDASLKMRPTRYFEHVEEITRAREAFAREAFETRDPRVGFVLFSTPDWAGHVLSNVSSEERRRELYASLLEVVDECAAGIAELADNVVLMSDHGFEYKQTNVHLNEWLHDEGYFETRTGGSVDFQRAALESVKAVASRSDRVLAVLRRVYNRLLGTRMGEQLTEAVSMDIDHAGAVAWQHQYGCVYVNDDRFDTPTVEDPEPLIRQLAKEMREVRADDGTPLFREVLTAAEAYEDPEPDAPDVIARPAQGCFPTSLSSPTGGYASPTDNFEHRYRGMFAATGPLYDESASVMGMSIVDVLPTLLHALGHPLAPDFTGTANTEILRTDREPTEMAYIDVPQPQFQAESDSAVKDDVVEERLSDLGYIE